MIDVSNQLKELRKKAGLSQEELAKTLFVSRQAVSKWETGETVPDLENLVALANLFDVSLDYLILGKTTSLERTDNTNIEENSRPSNIWEFLEDNWYLILFILPWLYVFLN